MEHHYRRFVEQLKLRNLSPTTLKSYTETVQRHFRFCQDRRIDPDSLESARSYLLYLRVDLDRAPSTVNVVYSALKRYFVEGQVAAWSIEAVPRPRRPRRLPVVLSKEQILNLFDATPRWRDRVIFMVAYAGGLRRIEVRHLRIEDIDSKKMRIFIHKAKGDKERYVMLSRRLLDCLRKYWLIERPSFYLFPSDKKPGEPLCGDAISRVFRRSRDRARLPREATFHCLRHYPDCRIIPRRQAEAPYSRRISVSDAHWTRDNQRLSRKVRSASSGRKRPGTCPEELVCARAFSFRRRSAWR